MLRTAMPRHEQTCIWVSAGLLTYKLCDRDFDCEHCPLDAALRGCPQRMALRRDASPGNEAGADSVPDDRVYSTGHTWLQPLAGRSGRTRFGIDRFAASFLLCPRYVRRNPSTEALLRGEMLCAIELEPALGTLPLGMPVMARVSRWNRTLETEPAVLIDAPYDEGWIAELTLEEDGALGEMLAAEVARDQTRLDARRFRRRLALQLLADEHLDEPDGRRPASDADLREILGGPRYLAVVRELVH